MAVATALSEGSTGALAQDVSRKRHKATAFNMPLSAGATASQSALRELGSDPRSSFLDTNAI